MGRLLNVAYGLLVENRDEEGRRDLEEKLSGVPVLPSRDTVLPFKPRRLGEVRIVPTRFLWAAARSRVLRHPRQHSSALDWVGQLAPQPPP